ncbi:MAG: hypothetical protein GOV02_01640, partial [Candidatus Aenigmarchaeota archaeon]|nr:hypothetical protein [Candidatus Aenigmarchaeota archaeon]
MFMIKTIIFDYGNVVFEPVTEGAIKKVIKKYNVSEEVALGLFATRARKEGYRIRTGKMTAKQYWKAVGKKLGTTHKETMKLRKEILEGYKPKPGML